MKLNILKFKEDIAGDRSDVFSLEFPKARIKIADLKTRPNCSICIRNALMAILEHKDYMQTLEKIYGEEVHFDEDLLKLKERGELEFKRVDVFTASMSDWEDIASNYMKRHGGRVEYISTAYNAEKDEIIATAFMKNIGVVGPHKRQEHINNLPMAPQPAPQPIMQPPPPEINGEIIEPAGHVENSLANEPIVSFDAGPLSEDPYIKERMSDENGKV